jgi:prepilin-type N-terminal cleavage/methylation domain-containing protein
MSFANTLESKFSHMCQIESKKKESGENGFSLIELIIVVLIVAILATLALPSIQRTLQLYRLENGTSFILHRLTETRLAAIKRNRDTWLEINQANRTLTLKSTNDAGQQISLGYPTNLPEGIQFHGATPDSIVFSSLGRNRANGNTQIKLRLAAANRHKTISVSSTGNITTANN